MAIEKGTEIKFGEKRGEKFTKKLLELVREFSDVFVTSPSSFAVNPASDTANLIHGSTAMILPPDPVDTGYDSSMVSVTPPLEASSSSAHETFDGIRPCHPDEVLPNWKITYLPVVQPHVNMDTNGIPPKWNLNANVLSEEFFEEEIPPEIERMIQNEDRVRVPHQEEV